MEHTMLYSVELTLQITGGDDPGWVNSYHLYSLFLHLINRVNPALAAAMHGDDGPKPFTVSLPNLGKRWRLLGLGDQVRFRLTLLQEQGFISLLDALWGLPPDASLPLGGARAVFQALATTPSQSPWAAFSSFPQLLEEAGEGRQLRLSFLSPTTFRSKGERNVLFPDPSLVFGSLLARWNAFAPASLHLNREGEAVSAVRLSGYRLSTRMLDFGSYKELGFYGYATYELGESLTCDEVKGLQALGAFAFFSGVGAKTTMGMGQVRTVDSARFISDRTGKHPA